MTHFVVFTDAGKDGDDLLAVHVLMQAKAAGLIAEITLVTTDEIPCGPQGRQDPKGQFGLRALYLKMHMDTLQQQLNLPTEYLPRIIPGPMTNYYSYDSESDQYMRKDTGSAAFYPNAEVKTYYASGAHILGGCLLQGENWLASLNGSKPTETTLINIAPFDAISDFLNAVPLEERPYYTVVNMGYNKPYTQEDLQEKVKEPQKLSYNIRSTATNKARPAAGVLIRNGVFQVVSGLARILPEITQKPGVASTTDIMARAYPTASGQYAPVLLQAVMNFVKESKYHKFWPHDVVPTLMAIIDAGNPKLLGYPLQKEMLFTEVVKIPARELSLRQVNGAEVLVRVDAERNDGSVASDEHFIYGTELDKMFFTSLLHVIALGSLKEQDSPLAACYQGILQLKAELFALKQNGLTDPEKEKQINSLWVKANLWELQKQLLLQAQTNEPIMQNYLSADKEAAENKEAFPEECLRWAREIEAFITLYEGQELPESLLGELNAALQAATTEKKYNALVGVVANQLRAFLMPTPDSCALLKEKGSLGREYRRTTNSILYSTLAQAGNFITAFGKGARGMSEDYKNLLSLQGQSGASKKAFYLHLALHDAGKGDSIKKAVHRDDEGNYLIHLPSGVYYKLNEAKKIAVSNADEFDAANAFVDHDEALEAYAAAGSIEKKCTATEYLLWQGPNPTELPKEVFDLSDRLLNLCNEINVAQVVQGEIPFAGIRKGLESFFAAYRETPQLAKLVFAHHCYDIFGAVAINSMGSITGGAPEIHLKIQKLYNILMDVAAHQDSFAHPAEEAYNRYRRELAKAIPDILGSEPSAHDEAITRVAQMLRCHLFKTAEVPETKAVVFAEAGQYDKRTPVFVRSIDAAFHLLSRRQRQKLVACLNNTGVEGPSVMVGYGPKLFLCAATGAESVKEDPINEQEIAERLSPILGLYANLYELQVTQSKAQYSVIEVDALAQIIEKMFHWYRQAEQQEKAGFAAILWALQAKGLAAQFLANLGDIKMKSPQEQLTQLGHCLAAAQLESFRIVDGKLIENQPRVTHYFEEHLRNYTLCEIYQRLQNEPHISKQQKNQCKKDFLNFQLDNLAEISQWQLEVQKKRELVTATHLHQRSLAEPQSSIEAANQLLLAAIKTLIIDTQWDIGILGGEKVFNSAGEKNLIPKGMYAVIKGIEKAEQGETSYSLVVEETGRLLKASAERTDHGFFNKRGETTTIFYQKAQNLLDDAEGRFAPVVC